MIKFRGHKRRTLDDKGRLVLPSSFRDLIFEQVPDGKLVLTIYNTTLVGMTPQQYQQAEEEFDKLATPSLALEEIITLFIGCYEEVVVSKQGRIALPVHLRQTAGLGQEVAIMGVGKRFQIVPIEEIDTKAREKKDVSQELADHNIKLPI